MYGHIDLLISHIRTTSCCSVAWLRGIEIQIYAGILISLSNEDNCQALNEQLCFKFFELKNIIDVRRKFKARLIIKQGISYIKVSEISKNILRLQTKVQRQLENGSDNLTYQKFDKSCLDSFYPLASGFKLLQSNTLTSYLIDQIK